MEPILDAHSSHTDQGMTGAEARQLRERLGMSQRHLAKLLGLDPTTIWRVENNRRRFSPKNAVRLALLAHRLRPLARNVCPHCRGAGVLDGNIRPIAGIRPASSESLHRHTYPVGHTSQETKP